MAAGSLFAALQSAGAGGAWAATAATAGKVAGVITGVGAGAVAAFFA